MNKSKLILIDGYSLINRAFYAISGKSMLTTSDGIPTNAIYGFLNILFRYIDVEKPDYICIALDMKKPTFRHNEYEGYKATRKKMPDDLAVQIPFIIETLEALNFGTAQMEGYEADDLLGTLSKTASENGIEVVVVSGDRDLIQVVKHGVTVKVPITKGGKTDTEVYNEESVYDKYTLKPTQLIELKALMGDSSDNIPGVKGVGEKTALTLVQKYGSLDSIYANIEEITGALKTKLIENKENAYLSKRLATIIRDVPFKFDISRYKISEYDNEKLFNLFSRLQFKSLIDKFSLSKDGEIENKAPLEIDFIGIEDEKELEDLIKKIFSKGFCGLDFRNIKDDNFAIGISLGEEKAYYIQSNNININIFKKHIGQILNNENVRKYISNFKNIIHDLKKIGLIADKNFFDISIAAYLLDSSLQKYAINDIANKYLEVTCNTFEDKTKEISQNAYLHVAISEIIEGLIKECGQEPLFYDVEMPLPRIMDDMETIGMKLDLKALREYGDDLCTKISEVEREIIELAGETFNMNSPKQLGQILFEKLKLPVIKKNKNGYSTDAEVLEELKGQHLIIDKILTNRQLAKLNNTYVEALFGLVDNNTSRIHTKFNQTGTVTGRFTSIEPNLQNIPYRQEIGRKIRKVFTSSNDDYILVGADYSQIELRILAHITSDENLINAYMMNMDIHAMTASKIFNVSQNEVTPLLRTRAKAINFGIIYGLGEYSLARDIGVSRKEAKKYIEDYLGQYPKVKEYMTNIVVFAREHGYVETIFGRRRYLPEIKSKNFNIRSFAERAALNAPIQGTAADIMKLAMVKIYQGLKAKQLKSEMVLQVHDEILIDAFIPEKEIVKDIVKKAMESVADLKVPLLVEVKEGINWYETK